MAPSIPLPVRVVVGLAVTGWDTVRNLPSELPALSVSIAGHAVRLSMRVQQEITELAARGDELLAGITSRPSEHPVWAHFDEEDDAAVGGTASTTDIVGADGDSGDGGVPGPARRSPFDEVDLDVDVAWVAVGDEVFNDDVELGLDPDAVVLDVLEEGGEVTIAASVSEDGEEVRVVVLVEQADEAIDSVTDRGSDEEAPPPPRLHVVPDAPTPDDHGEQPDAGAAIPAVSGTHIVDSGSAGPTELPGYDRMTLAQVRGRLRGLSPDDVAGLLAYEQGGAGRAPFLTLLSNRIATLEHEPQ